VAEAISSSHRVSLGSPSRGSSPGAANQIGASTAFKKEQVDAGRDYDGAKYGNEVALNAHPDKAERSITADRKARGAHQPAAIPHQLKIFCQLLDRTNAKAER
jgi:hypothetical protein